MILKKLYEKFGEALPPIARIRDEDEALFREVRKTFKKHHVLQAAWEVYLEQRNAAAKVVPKPTGEVVEKVSYEPKTLNVIRKGRKDVSE